MKREIEGIYTRVKDKPCVKTGRKAVLVWDLLDGLDGKKVRIVVEEVK